MTESPSPAPGTIITFYSYKGGTGRSMALANVAWILASNNKRVLIVDWDLEAPGLHRYLHPFLSDQYLTNSPGIINLVHEYQSAVVNEASARSGARNLPLGWYEEHADILRYATEVTFPFEGSGKLHFVPAGMQDATYATLVNRFNWQQLFDNLGGYLFFEAIKKQMKAEYHYVLIDSRTGVSDTSGLCTVQLPDQLVVCFTLNNQSIEGASAVAASAFEQRKSDEGESSLRIWPVPTRIELAEKQKADRARERARALFDPLFWHMNPETRDEYWGAVEVLYQSFYAYEEILAIFGDQPGQSHSILSSMEQLAGFLSDKTVQRLAPIPEKLRRDSLASFSRRPSSEILRALSSLGAQYEEIRRTMKASNERTSRMSEIVYRVQTLIDQTASSALVLQLFSDGQDGLRIVALAVAQASPLPEHLVIAIEGIRNRRSAFEQYQALVLANQLVERLGDSERKLLLDVIQSQLGDTIDKSDPGRWESSQELLRKLTPERTSTTIAQHNEWSKFAPTPRQLGADEKWNVLVSNLSYNRRWALSLKDVLVEHGFLVDLDQEAITPGDGLSATLRRAHRESQAVILVLSRVSLNSDWVGNREPIVESTDQRKKGVQFILITLDRGMAVPSSGDQTVLDFSSYPDGPNGGELLRLLYAVNGMPMSVEAARFASQQDDDAQEVAAVIGAAVRNSNPDRLVLLFEQGGLLWQISSALGCKSSEGLIKLDRKDEAIQILGKLLERFPKAIRPKQLLALALTRRGSPRDLSSAQDILGVLYERGARDTETLTLYARTWADRFYQSHDINDLRQSRDLYAEASRSVPDDYFSESNVASISAILGKSYPEDYRKAKIYAARIEKMVSKQYGRDYWMYVALAESFLIKGDYTEAAAYYTLAIAMVRSEIGTQMTTWKQACRLMEALKPKADERALIRTVFEHLPECDNRVEVEGSKRS